MERKCYAEKINFSLNKYLQALKFPIREIILLHRLKRINPDTQKIKEVPLEESSQTFNYGAKDITNLDDCKHLDN
tara:strand:- start:689 stop:913 length:225 start_codon:yes stop_codon:yes gene_type:complete